MRVVLEHKGLHFGLLVSDLGVIVDLQVSAAPGMGRLQGGGLITSIAQSGRELVPLLAVDCIAQRAAMVAV